MPKPDLWHVYDIVEFDGEIVYVGCSRKPNRRFPAHRRNNICSLDADYQIVKTYKSREAALRAEARRIRKIKPRGNKRHAGKLCGLKNPNTMPVDEARDVWLKTPAHYENGAVLFVMPGWTYDMAVSHFGTRH